MENVLNVDTLLSFKETEDGGVEIKLPMACVVLDSKETESVKDWFSDISNKLKDGQSK